MASDFPEFAADVYTQAFRNLGVANPRVLRATSRQDVFNANAEELLDGVTGVFMTGGDQMRLVSILGGTKFADKLRHLVRDTKIVLAGTSAGAAGMSTSMIVRGESTLASSQEQRPAFARTRISEKYHHRSTFHRTRPYQPS